MTDFSGILFALSIAAAIVLTIIFIVKHVKKQPTKKIKASIGICLMVAILMVIIGVATMPDSSTGAHLNNLKNGFPELLTNKTIKYF
jgi:Na+/proline symporter